MCIALVLAGFVYVLQGPLGALVGLVHVGEYLLNFNLDVARYEYHYSSLKPCMSIHSSSTSCDFTSLSRSANMSLTSISPECTYRSITHYTRYIL